MCACSSDPGPRPSHDAAGTDAYAERSTGASDLEAGAALDSTSELGDSLADRGKDATATPDADVASCVPGQVWKSTSRAIELNAYVAYVGVTGYRKVRDELTTEQLALLDKLCVITPGILLPDDSHFVIAVTDVDGTTTRYRGAEGDVLVGDPSSGGMATVGSRPVLDFMHTFSCIWSDQTGGWAQVEVANEPLDAGDAAVDAGIGPASGQDATAPSHDASVAGLGPLTGDDPGCLHGISASRTCVDIRLRVKISTPGAYELATEQCLPQTGIGLYSEDGTVELAASGTPNATDCARLSYVFSTAGVYPVALERRDAAGCRTSTGHSDFFFRVTPTK